MVRRRWPSGSTTSTVITSSEDSTDVCKPVVRSGMYGIFGAMVRISLPSVTNAIASSGGMS